MGPDPRLRDDLDVLVGRRALPSEVVAARERFREVNAGNEQVIAPRIELHLVSYRAAVDELQALHRRVAEETDLDLVGKSRQAACWQVSGRVLGLLEAVLALLRAGFASEVAPLLRAVHEANTLLRVMTSRDAGVLKRWLSGVHVKPSRVLAAEDARQKVLAAEMREAGIEPPGRTRSGMEAIYEFLSEMSHVRRSRVVELVGVEPRTMPTGPHPDWANRGVFVFYAGVHVMEAVSAVGFALARSLGQEAVDRTQSTFHALDAMREAARLDPGTMSGVSS